MDTRRQDLHTIRLTGPWEFQVAAGEWRTTKLPAAWGTILQSLGVQERDPAEPSHFRGAKGDFLARRRFQRPTGIDGGVRVWMVVPATDSRGIRVWINDTEATVAACKSTNGVEFDVTDQLQSSNLITVEFDIDRLIVDDAGVFSGALIEIRTAGDSAE